MIMKHVLALVVKLQENSKRHARNLHLLANLCKTIANSKQETCISSHEIARNLHLLANLCKIIARNLHLLANLCKTIANSSHETCIKMFASTLSQLTVLILVSLKFVIPLMLSYYVIVCLKAI